MLNKKTILACWAVIFLSLSAVVSASDWLPPEDEFDWLRLNNGEWLKGELVAMYDEKLKFQSDKLGEQEISIGDIVYLRTAKIQSLRLLNGEILMGKILVTNGSITVVDADRTIPRAELLSIASGGERESDYWDGGITLGFDKRSGNTNQEDLGLIVDATRRTSVTRFKANFLGVKSEVDGEDTQDSRLLNLSLDWFFSPRVYFRPMAFEYFSDPFQNIKRRITYSAQLGYFIIDDSRTTWDIYGGPGYQETRYENVLPGSDDKETTDVIELGTNLDYKVTDSIDFDVLYNVKLVDEDSGKKSEHFESGLKIAINGSLDFTVRYIWNRIDQPVPDELGVFPEKEDERILVGLNYDF